MIDYNREIDMCNFFNKIFTLIYIVFLIMCERAATSENVPSDMCAQQRFAQFDQNHNWAHFDSQGCKVSSCGQGRPLSDCART